MSEWQQLQADLAALKAQWPGEPWTWDERFRTVASAFDHSLEPSARSSAMLAFPRGWTMTSLETAPPAHRALAERTGGLRAGQRLLAGDPVTAGALYGLWWPWGGGDRITLRIGLADLDGAAAPPLDLLRALFDVTA